MASEPKASGFGAMRGGDDDPEAPGSTDPKGSGPSGRGGQESAKKTTGPGCAPFAGICSDLAGRLPHYCADWRDGMQLRLLPAAVYIFFASVIPALTFGQQLDTGTEGQVNGIQVLIVISLCGCLQSIFGAQPFLIVGVSEPIVIVYLFMYQFAVQAGIPFMPWATVSLFWAAGMMFVMAATNACIFIDRFTRFSGEIFGMLICILFIQAAVEGLLEEFTPEIEATNVAWGLFNGSFAIIIAMGFFSTARVLSAAGGWRFFNGPVRNLLSSYAIPISLLLWTAFSFIPHATYSGIPEGVPYRLEIQDIWNFSTCDGCSESWWVLWQVSDLSLSQVLLAAVPGFIIGPILFYFDHSVSSQLAQQREFGLKRPGGFHWDLMLLSLMTVACGLLGLPPVNGVLPQAPMHSRACAMEPSKGSKASQVSDSEGSQGGSPGPSFEIQEQRVTNLVQSLLCGLLVLATPWLVLIPRAVLWGYFLFMAVESLPGNQFWDRLQLFITDRKRLHMIFMDSHNKYIETVKLSTISAFTLVQLLGLSLTYGITWAGIAGIFFPVVFFLMIPLRTYVLPSFFSMADLQALDATEFEEVDALDAPAFSDKAPGPTRMTAAEYMQTETQNLFRGELAKHVSRKADGDAAE